MNINICKDFSDTPGGRHKKEGKYSGEEFRDTILITKFEESIKNNEKLTINLDGGYGYPTSFLEEAFGGLARKCKKQYSESLILNTLHFISNDEPSLIDEIKQYISDVYREG